MNELFSNYKKFNKTEVLAFIKQLTLAVIIGIVVGIVASSFGYFVSFATEFRRSHYFMIYLLPLGAIVISFLYKRALGSDPGTNIIISSIQTSESDQEEKDIPILLAPLIYIATIITHLIGGSAGREGAALQLGGSIGSALSRTFKLNASESKHISIMCGMAAAFSALFGTPIAAAIFAMEVISVGIMHYSAFVFCAISSIIAHFIAEDIFHLAEPDYTFQLANAITIPRILIIIVLAALGGILSNIFCKLLHSTSHLFAKYFENVYLRALVGGAILLVLTLIMGTDYNGTGVHVIIKAMDGNVRWYDFIMKMIFTAITLSIGYKGGEIVPSIFIGSTFGALFGNIIGFDPSLCAAVGVATVFCGVTNSPVSSLIICFEMFGFESALYMLIAVGVSYVISGYDGLYTSQQIVYSKFQDKEYKKSGS